MRHTRVFLAHRDRRVAAIIDAEDLDRLTEATEGLADIQAVQVARVEVVERGTVPWEKGKAELGLV